MTYIYKPLESQCIRLLELLPGSEEDAIRCNVEPSTLHDANCMGFEAVSYTWGAPGAYATIKLEGCPLSIQADHGWFLLLASSHPFQAAHASSQHSLSGA